MNEWERRDNMNKSLENELIAETKMEDIPENYQELARIVGIENLIKLSRYAMGEKIYIPKPSSLYMKTRNKRILREYNGYNETELAKRYDITVVQVRSILRGYDPKQMSLFDLPT